MLKLIERLVYESWVQIKTLFHWRRRNALYVVLFGGPGAGKSTIAARLSARHNIPHVSTGNLIRREIAEATDIGKRFEADNKAGKLLPDSVAATLLRDELTKPEFYTGAILDGFPRTMAQAPQLRKMLGGWGNKVDVAIYIEVPEADLIERLSLRRTCTNPKCGKTFHLKLDKPKVEGICDKCGSALKQRDDDRPEAISVRLKEFERNFAPLFDWYKRQGLLVTVRSTNAMGIDQVWREILFAVEEVD